MRPAVLPLTGCLVRAAVRGVLLRRPWRPTPGWVEPTPPPG